MPLVLVLVIYRVGLRKRVEIMENEVSGFSPFPDCSRITKSLNKFLSWDGASSFLFLTNSLILSNIFLSCDVIFLKASVITSDVCLPWDGASSFVVFEW